MRVLIATLLVVTGMAGCTDDGGDSFFQDIADVVTGSSKGLDGDCGGKFNENWDRQIIIDIQFTKETEGHVAPAAIDVDATYRGTQEDPEKETRAYAETSPDSNGCLSFKLNEEGQYMFTGYAPSNEQSNCMVGGRLDGAYSGQAVVGGTLVMDQLLCW